MCHIPVFCWLSASVLENMMSDEDTNEISKILTEMCTHFLLIQTSLKNQKYHGATVENPKKLSQSDREMILKLGKLAFQQLEKEEVLDEFDMKMYKTSAGGQQRLLAALRTCKRARSFQWDGKESTASKMSQEHREGDTAPKMNLPQEHREGDTASKMSLPQEHREGDTASKMSLPQEHREGDTAPKMSLPQEHRERDTASRMSVCLDGEKRSAASKRCSSEGYNEGTDSKRRNIAFQRKRTGHVLKEDLLQCDMCKEKLKDLVSVPSGHRYCRQCICKWDLSELVQIQQAEFSPVNPDHCYTGPGDVACDFCTGRKLRAVKSCLTCPASLCENHVRQHYTIPALQRHTLVEVTGDLEQRLCQQHHRVLEMFCKTDQTHICKVCAVEEHQGHSKLYREISSVPEPKSLLKMTLGNIKPEHFQTFKQELNEDYPDSLGNHLGDLDVSGVTERMLDCFGVEGAQRITLHFLNVAIPLRKVQEANKENLRQKFQHMTEGLSSQGKVSLLNEVYTELYVTEGGSGEVNNEHEIRQIEMTSKTQTPQATPIKCNDIFTVLSARSKQIRTVLTKGIAGIGKTVSVQKFILDWAERKANEDITVIVPLPFRDLNLKKEKYSLIQLLHHYAPELKNIKDIKDRKVKILLIFDGLDEYRFPLSFQNSEFCSDVTKSISLDVLLTNLIKGNLLPSALLWITSRPAAASQIPPECVHQVTEIHGFRDTQKEEYFRKRISDQSMANRIIKHIKSSRSLHIMCHIPVFCWLSATVLKNMMSNASTGEIPKTLTEMYTHFLLLQISLKNKKYHGTTMENPKKLLQSDKEMILKLGKLAFQQLEKGNLIFYEEDLRECGIDVSKASEYSSVCTEIFREELGLYREKVFCFVHLSVQEHLAAVYAHFSCVNERKNVFSREDPRIEYSYARIFTLSDLHPIAVDKALQSEKGHLDFFLRFLLGLSLDSSQTLLQDLMIRTSSKIRVHSTVWTDRFVKMMDTDKYIKMRIRGESSPERIINLFHCLNELNDNSLVEEIQSAFRSGKLSSQKLEPHQCSALAYVLLMSEEVLDEFDLKMYKTSAAGQQRLLPVLKTCKKARSVFFVCCNLFTHVSSASCETIGSALKLVNSPLRELDLSCNNLADSGVKLLCAGLQCPNCKLQKLWLSGCNLSTESCGSLASALQSVSSPLRELDLSYNTLTHSGVKLLCGGLLSPNCQLQRVDLNTCRLTEDCCVALSSVLRSPHSYLRELELRHNDLQDLGVKLLSAGLEDSQCKLEKLGLSGCLITEEGCASLVSALRSNPSHLRELDLSYNHPGDSGLMLLSALLGDLHCKLKKLELDHAGEYWMGLTPRKYVCQLTLDQNTAHGNLSLSERNRRVTWTPKKQPYPDHSERFRNVHRVLCSEALTGRFYWEVEWSGTTRIGATYKSISREEGCMGMDDKSFVLFCQGDTFYFIHNSKTCAAVSPPHPCNRLGVYLDWAAGTLHFYRVLSGTLTPLYTFNTTFIEPLYAGFELCGNSTVTLCRLEGMIRLQ
ncbi:NACHT, LRR and PYD domains-containing protein 12-like [Chanos chanos]|uniref:NACHT, LRR and PYD domains-containing protein 12-like n=1 Tax=Chanos chanos TaxID=29144 RepID=A0A6J2US26_CHACN|nr:NACHT, LRR and PYD domains-containing protein 12-like [Chanos chanos]